MTEPAGEPTFIAEQNTSSTRYDTVSFWNEQTVDTMATINTSATAFPGSEKKNWLKSHPEIFNPIVKQTGGTCFAVAALTLCEVMHALQYGEKIQLSIEDILNSFHKGQVRDVLQYVHEHGVSLQIPTGQKLYIDSFTHCKRMNENDVLKELDMHPVCGVIHSSSCLKRLKPGEIYQGSKSSDGPLHALLIVGYGSYNGVNFYLVRNSWGTTWCSNGYGM
ncbi:unnamed protein product [Camellia sinensis]